jgi:phage tail sheath protein FI
MVGTATKGPVNSPELITKIGQLEMIFGATNPNHPAVLTAHMYLKYGRQLRFVRVGCSGDLFAAYADMPSQSAGAAVATGSVDGPFTIAAASPAFRDGTEVGPYTIGANNKEMMIEVDASGVDQPVTLTTGALRTAQQVVDEINAQTTGLTASVVGNKVSMVSNLSGSSSALNLKTVVNSAYLTLGLATGLTLGVDATDTLDISINGDPDQSIVLTAGNRSASQVVDDINAVLTDALASVSGLKVRITSTLTGVAASVQIQASSTADTVLGFDNAVHDGTAAGSASIMIQALYAGTDGNNISVKIQDALSEAGAKTITVMYKGLVMEVFRNLVKTDTSDNYWVTVVNASSEFIRVVDYPGVVTQPANTVSTVLTGGTDGLVGLTDGDYIGTDINGTRTGLQLFRDPDSIDVNLVAIPGVTSMACHSALVSLCEARGDCMTLIDPPLGLTPTQVVDFIRAQGAYALTRTSINSSYAAMYYPWIKLYDSANSLIQDAPPSSAAIRTYIYNDVVGETWFAPAGVNRGRIVEAIGIERTLTIGERDYLYENRVNPIANFSKEGIVIWGQKTLQVAPTALDRVNVRRLLLYLRKVIATAVVPLIFEPNTPRLWRRFVNLVTPFLRDVKVREGLNDFRVTCDETTNTAVVIDRSEFRARIMLKPTKAAEFIIIDFVLVAQTSTFNEFTA